MLSTVATPALRLPSPRPLASSQHQYGTRIRSNSVMRPSARLRQTPDPPRRIKPAKVKSAATTPDAEPVEMPEFPPPQVMLHSDDATSKVFIAIGRSFMSVDNKAMTIKDLAEMTIKFGLMCQNVSAAGQAITTYIRNHMHRCEVQQDQPLLLRHVLSGTPSDDDLVSALHSRSGGAHCVLNQGDNRLTNFRRGTMVWYLSKAAGVPCPFARSGIRLCEYGENGRVGTAISPGKERKRERDRLRRAEQCGQKRKRPVRSCAARPSESDSSSEEERPALKVKLTLRLNPSLVSKSSASSAASPPPSEVIDLSSDSDSDDESMSSDSSEDEEENSEETPWCVPAYPRESVSIPSHPSSSDAEPLPSQQLPNESQNVGGLWRSSPTAASVVSASPPPDSDDEEDDMHGSYSSRIRDGSYSSWANDDDEDVFADMEDTDTQWGESSGPMSPPAQFEEEGVQVKHEPRDVAGFLDAWEDLDGSVSDSNAFVGKSQQVPANSPEDLFTPKHDPLESWAPWSDPFEPAVADVRQIATDSREYIKKEGEDAHYPVGEYPPLSPSSSPRSSFSVLPAPCSPHDLSEEAYLKIRRPSDSMWKDAEMFSPDSVQPHDFEDGVWHLNSKHPEVRLSVSVLPTPPDSPLTELDEAPSVKCEEQEASFAVPLPSPSCSPASVLISSPTAERSADAASSVSDRQFYLPSRDEPVILHTSQPCVPAICAIELEGIAVYQMVLGSSCIIRRVDTNFVNVSPILQFFGLDSPDIAAMPTSVIVSKGSSLVCGIWMSLPSARDFFQSQTALNLFLSDELHTRFSSLQSLGHKHVEEQSGHHFGPHFQSTIDAKRESTSSFHLQLPSRASGSPWELGLVPQWDVEDHLLSVHPPFALGSATLKVTSSSHDDMVIPETPLSPTEEEMFRVLCAAADWEPPAPTDASSPESSAMDCDPPCQSAESTIVALAIPSPKPEQVRPVRRSRRVANAAANRPTTRSLRKGAKATHS